VPHEECGGKGEPTRKIRRKEYQKHEKSDGKDYGGRKRRRMMEKNKKRKRHMILGRL
jgi:hypothetical protein